MADETTNILAGLPRVSAPLRVEMDEERIVLNCGKVNLGYIALTPEGKLWTWVSWEQGDGLHETPNGAWEALLQALAIEPVEGLTEEEQELGREVEKFLRHKAMEAHMEYTNAGFRAAAYKALRRSQRLTDGANLVSKLLALAGEQSTGKDSPKEAAK